MTRKQSTTPAARIWRPVFLQNFEASMNWSASARAAGVTRQAAHQAYQQNKAFRDAVDEAKRVAIDSLELTAVERARHSDRMLEFMLKAHKPDVYDRPKNLNLAGHDGGPLFSDIADTLDHTLDALAKRLEPPVSEDPEPTA